MFASLTDLYAVFPRAQQGLRPDVPVFTAVNELHFSPKWQTKPDSRSALKMVAKAVLRCRMLRNSAYIYT